MSKFKDDYNRRLEEDKQKQIAKGKIRYIGCPSCEKAELELQKESNFALMLVVWLAGGVIAWIPILGWIGFPLCIIGGIACLFSPRGFWGKCPRCGQTHHYTKDMIHK